jgi:hypothetical protein
MTLHVICWKWRSRGYHTRFEARHVNVLGAMLRRHLRMPHRLLCVTDDARGIEHETFPIWSDAAGVGNPNGPGFPSCFRRLKIFSAAQQREMGIRQGDRIASIDLDVVLVDDVTPIFNREEDFVGWRAKGKHHETVLNGTLFSLRAGSHEDVWSEFDATRSPAIARAAGYLGSDQAWLSLKLACKVAAWGSESGIVSYMRDLLLDPSLPQGARLVSFHGQHKPWDAEVQAEAPWVAEHWRD